MIEGWSVIALPLGYVSGLFALAWFADKTFRRSRGSNGRPLTYALSLAVYCTSWSLFGGIGFAAANGYNFIAVDLGAVLLFAFGWRFLVRIVRLAKRHNITSVADFMAARYGKSQAVATVVTIISVAGTLPYIALQLKAVVLSLTTLLVAGNIEMPHFDVALVSALLMAMFAVLFGTRHIDATEHQQGLMVAVAVESIIKLTALLAVGLFVVFSLFGSTREFLQRAVATPEIRRIFAQDFDGGFWVTATFLSLVCILLLPRQFHVTVVENKSEDEIRRAAWLFPVYLILINLFVMPIAAAGMMVLPTGGFDADMFLVSLPIHAGADVIAIVAFLGGLSAATAMVVVDSVALAIMVCNGLVVPLLLRRYFQGGRGPEAIVWHLLAIRRISIFAVILLGYIFYLLLGQWHGLASIGFVSFAAIAQFAPAFFGGLIWRNATARGAVVGILTGFAVWTYTLLLPWVVEAGWLSRAVLTDGPLGLGFLAPQALLYVRLEPLTHGVLWSIACNVVAFVTVSLSRAPAPIERLQANLFVLGKLPRPAIASAFRMWRSRITNGELQRTVADYLGAECAERSFAQYAARSGTPLSATSLADSHAVRFGEHLLASAIGTSSSHLVLSLIMRRNDVGSQSALKLLDDASEALRYSRDLLQSALDQVRHGLSVFDKDMKLICWNRQFRELLNLPPELASVGAPLDLMLQTCAARGDFGPGDVNKLVSDRLMKLAIAHETFHEPLDGDRRILEIRTSPMPQGGIVTTYSDITERVEAARALERANETLERRVRERTAELTEVNRALAAAKRKADEANLDKTRFLVAASHDVLQPLNAARLFASSLLERQMTTPEAKLARNIDAALEAVEEILNALIEISRLDAGKLEPHVTAFALSDVFARLELEFLPLAQAKGLELRIVPCTLWVSSDRCLLRRVLQNLLSNAIKYTPKGKVLVGVRRRGNKLRAEVRDTGPGIPKAKRALIFKEFHRLEETAQCSPGLGLGLAIVERIGKVLSHSIEMQSVPGRGSMFSVVLPRAAPRPVGEITTAVALASGRMTGVKVLCIDNEPDVLNGMRTLLEGWGCVPLTAGNAEQASVLVTGMGIRPDIILADFHLDGSTGFEAISTLRATANLHVPAVIITADYSADVQRAVRQRGYALLRKPLKAGALRALVHQLTLRRAVAAE